MKSESSAAFGALVAAAAEGRRDRLGAVGVVGSRIRFRRARIVEIESWGSGAKQGGERILRLK